MKYFVKYVGENKTNASNFNGNQIEVSRGDVFECSKKNQGNLARMYGKVFKKVDEKDLEKEIEKKSNKNTEKKIDREPNKKSIVNNKIKSKKNK